MPPCQLPFPSFTLALTSTRDFLPRPPSVIIHDHGPSAEVQPTSIVDLMKTVDLRDDHSLDPNEGDNAGDMIVQEPYLNVGIGATATVGEPGPMNGRMIDVQKALWPNHTYLIPVKSHFEFTYINASSL
ncbi:hypothetical protein CVT25_000438 [Psilocybe cyanescens]|uniref:Uncharacterized protein n=1 Tax=Psilocybe cyanescens TaxID=93625 RepID=A0A409XLY8_PSICY|nr:hypothetical protein CVT25_000438 [Psilocybe cyanescens]